MELRFSNVSKTFGDKIALSQFSTTLTEGIYGILGSNGAGKSTLMNLITDNIERESGNITYNGKDILVMGKKFREVIGYMPQQQGMYDDFSAKKFLMYVASLKGLNKKQAKQQIEYYLEIVGLENEAYRKVGGFSGGMKQRVLLAQALLGNPQILILDEPTAGLDPEERIRIRNFISELSKDKIVILATHVVSDIECIAKEVLLMKKGKLLMKGSPIQLIESIEGKVAEIFCTENELETIQKEKNIANIYQRKGGYTIRIVGDNIQPPYQIVNHNISLEDVYLYYLKGR